MVNKYINNVILDYLAGEIYKQFRIYTDKDVCILYSDCFIYLVNTDNPFIKVYCHEIIPHIKIIYSEEQIVKFIMEILNNMMQEYEIEDTIDVQFYSVDHFKGHLLNTKTIPYLDFSLI